MSEKIEAARATALRLLQPSARDVEHGLELHRNTLVVESYGFAPPSTAMPCARRWSRAPRTSRSRT
jgi:hypothetical protein